MCVLGGGTLSNYHKPHRPTYGVMVWYDISVDSRTHLMVISRTVTEQLYDDDILQLVMLLFLFLDPGLTF